MTPEPITPEEALELYLDNKTDSAAASTVRSHRYRLRHFVRWCSREGVENLNDVSGRDLHRYRSWRRDDGNLNKVSLKTQMSALRVFLKFCESIDAVPEDLHEKVLLPSVARSEKQRDVKIEAEEAFDVLDYLRKFEYASVEHVVFEVLWHTGMRTGSIRSLDVDDYHPRDAYLELEHRPESGTPLKNGAEGERLVGLSADICGLIDDYLETNRHDVLDENARAPLFSTEHGRPTTGTYRRWMYKVTRPCVYSGECPAGREVGKCRATEHRHCFECPVNVSPHAVRRGSITYHLLRDWPLEDVSGRVNANPDVLKQHYDRRTDKERLEQRRENLTKL